MRHFGVHVPRYALGGDFGVLAEIVERISWRAGIDSPGGVKSHFLSRLLLHALAAIEDCQIVVRGEVVGIDSLESLELLHGFVTAMLLIIGNAQLAAGIP